MVQVRSLAEYAALAAIVLMMSGCGKADDYAIPMSDAYKRLNAVNLQPSENGVFYQLETSVRGNSADEVTWEAGGSFASHSCRIALKPLDAAHTHVSVNCDSSAPASGAAAGLEHNMMRNRVIEMVDATLTGGAFNPALADGTTAWRWPGDGVDGSYADMVGEALKMDSDMRKDQRDAAAEEKEREAEQIAERPDPALGTSPDP